MPARELGLPFFPGVATPTELGRALRLGCPTREVFPASTLGGPAVRAGRVRAVYPDVRFIPTGGVDADVAPVIPRRALRARLRRKLDRATGACSASGVSTRSSGSRGRRVAMVAPRVPTLRPSDECRCDLVALGEVMLRLDPGDGRIATTAKFDVCEGGGRVQRRARAEALLRPARRRS